MSLHAVILAGGSGTRFWPLSRAKKPKQFLALVSGRTLIAETFLRVEPLCSSARTWVACGRDHAEAVRKALPGLPPAHLVIEPAARNTAPAIGLACVHALHEDRDATLMVLPSDHHIARPDAFRGALSAAARACANGDLLISRRPRRDLAARRWLWRPRDTRVCRGSLCWFGHGLFSPICGVGGTRSVLPLSRVQVQPNGRATVPQVVS